MTEVNNYEWRHNTRSCVAQLDSLDQFKADVIKTLETKWKSEKDVLHEEFNTEKSRVTDMINSMDAENKSLQRELRSLKPKCRKSVKSFSMSWVR